LFAYLADPFLMRFLTAVAVIVAGLLVYRLVSRLMLGRAPRNSTAIDPSTHGKPVLLYFTTPTCAPCRTVQRPAIQRLQALVGSRLEVVEIDASAQPELADQWGVWSVPTTFLIDPSGRPRHVNYGITSAEKLLHQLENIV